LYNDFFLGWRTARLARLKAFAYQLLILAVQYLIILLLIGISNKMILGDASLFSVILGLAMLIASLFFIVVCLYCTILIMVKRMRDLGIKMPRLVAMISYVVNIVIFGNLFVIINKIETMSIMGLITTLIITSVLLFNFYVLLGKSKQV
jgi:uncharacterized membrane protein YhaH (DUF805 family)